MTKEQIKEIINVDNLHINQMIEVIEQYIFDRKGKQIKIKDPKNNLAEIYRIITVYNDNVVPYYVKELGLNNA